MPTIILEFVSSNGIPTLLPLHRMFLFPDQLEPLIFTLPMAMTDGMNLQLFTMSVLRQLEMDWPLQHPTLALQLLAYKIETFPCASQKRKLPLWVLE